VQGLKLVMEVCKRTGRIGQTARFLSTRGERWLIPDHPNAGGERGKAVETPESWGSLVSSWAQHSGSSVRRSPALSQSPLTLAKCLCPTPARPRLCFNCFMVEALLYLMLKDGEVPMKMVVAL